MKTSDVIRAWKDVRYRRTLSPQQLAALPQHPAGLVELSDDDLRQASGMGGGALTTAITCTNYTWRKWRECGCGPVTTAITCTEYTFAGMKACCP